MDSDDLWQLLSSKIKRERDKGFKLLIEEMYVLILSMIMKGGSSKEDAEEIFWDGILVVDIESKKNRFGPKDNIQGFLKTVCRNIWLKKLRKNHPRFRNLDDYKDFVSEENITLFSLLDDDIQEKIRYIFDHLKPKCKELLTLIYFEERSSQEIINRLKMKSVDVLKTTKNRCMKALRDFLGGLGGKDFFY